LLHLPDSCLQRYELHPFFRITDCNASLSRLRSATSFLSRVFSSRNCFASCAWLTSIPSYLCFSRATSSTARPASTCFKAAIICASVCLLRDMPVPLCFDQIILSCVRIQGSRSDGYGRFDPAEDSATLFANFRETTVEYLSGQR